MVNAPGACQYIPGQEKGDDGIIRLYDVVIGSPERTELNVRTAIKSLVYIHVNLMNKLRIKKSPKMVPLPSLPGTNIQK